MNYIRNVIKLASEISEKYGLEDSKPENKIMASLYKDKGEPRISVNGYGSASIYFKYRGFIDGKEVSDNFVPILIPDVTWGENEEAPLDSIKRSLKWKASNAALKGKSLEERYEKDLTVILVNEEEIVNLWRERREGVIESMNDHYT